MADSETLSRCEQNITNFEIQYQAALQYMREGIAANDFNVQREGIFRVADSFMKITAMTWQCYQVELLIEYVIGTVVLQNVNNPVLILANCMSSAFYLASDIMAQFANMNY